MKKLFERFRDYSLNQNTSLLIEGRISDTELKYPELAKKREELDGESLLDALIAADPSGNQKYLMGAARILQNRIEYHEEQMEYEPWWKKGRIPQGRDFVDFYSPWKLADYVARLLPRYHNSMPYIRDQDAPFKDINAIKSFNALRAVVVTAERKKKDRENEKEQEEALKKAAKESTEFVDETPYHLILRPLTTAASCHWGRGTKWCISATKGENHFDFYTNKGKSFLFLLAKRKDIAPKWKKIALTLNQEGDFEEYHDAIDDPLSARFFPTLMLKTIVGEEVEEEMATLVGNESPNHFKRKETIIRNGLEPFKAQNGFDFNADDSVFDIMQLFRDTVVQQYVADLKVAAKRSVKETPPGAFDKEREEALEEYDAERKLPLQENRFRLKIIKNH